MLPDTPNKYVKTIVFFIITLSYFIFWWGYKLSILPGLHGDEAWSGLKAIEFQQTGITQVYGMNNYTGILQAIFSKFSFDIFGRGVTQLRVTGVVFNIIGLLIILITLYKINRHRWAIIFILIMAQCGLYLTSPRVAWEVNSYTLFFTALLFSSGAQMYKFPQKVNVISTAIFLLTNVVASYNHIIFASIGLSAFIGILLWSLRFQSSRYKNLLFILSINILNTIFVHLTMKSFSQLFVENLSISIFITLLLVCLEVAVLKLLRVDWAASKFDSKKIYVLTLASLTICGASFLIVHGIAYFEVISNSKIFIQTYSYECSLLFQGLFMLCGLCTMAYIFKFLLEDITHKVSSPPAFFIISYLGVLSCFTIKTSFRYYLILSIILALYLAYKISREPKHSRVLISTLLLSLFLTNIVQFDLFSTENMPVKAIRFNIGNGQEETSEHFLPKAPLIEFLTKNRVTHFQYLCDDPYFLDKPIQFYKLSNPWHTDDNSRAVIGYNYNMYGDGFIYFKKN